MLITILVGSLTDPETERDVLRDICNSDTSGLFILILALIGITGEWRHRTITSSLLAAPTGSVSSRRRRSRSRSQAWCCRC
jgi:hypothetical protein